jgi:DNA repair photolyase
VKVALSVTTLDSKLARALEPRASIPAKRLEALRQLQAAGVPTAVMVAPVIPAINEHEIEAILAAAAECGVKEAHYVLLRLPLELREIFREWLIQHYPGKLRHVMSLIQSSRGGKDYDAKFGERMRGSGLFADMIAKRFRLARERCGMKERANGKLRCDLFRPPVVAGGQLSLF